MLNAFICLPLDNIHYVVDDFWGADASAWDTRTHGRSRALIGPGWSRDLNTGLRLAPECSGKDGPCSDLVDPTISC